MGKVQGSQVSNEAYDFADAGRLRDDAGQNGTSHEEPPGHLRRHSNAVRRATRPDRSRTTKLKVDFIEAGRVPVVIVKARDLRTASTPHVFVRTLQPKKSIVWTRPPRSAMGLRDVTRLYPVSMA